MRKLFIFIALFLTVTLSGQVLPGVAASQGITPPAPFYHVKNGGNDALDGLTDATAWETIAKVNGFTFAAGDIISFKCGSTWRETLTVPRSGSVGNWVTFNSYSSGAKPQILGSDVSTWSASGTTNVWQCDATVVDPAGLGNGTSQGCDIMFDNSGTITQGLHKTYSSGYTNLTAEYHWTYNSGKVYVYAATDPDTRYTSVEIPQRDIPINLNQKEYIEIDGLDLRYFGQYGIYGGAYPTPDKSYLTIRDCDVSWSGLITPNAENDKDNFGIYAVYSHMLIHGCTIHDLSRRSISIYNYGSGFTVTDVIVENCTMYKGYHTTGIDISCGNGTTADFDGVIFRYNLIYEDIAGDDYGSELMNIESYYSAHYINNLQVYGNILIGSQNSAIHLYGVHGADIYNNTFVNHNTSASDNVAQIKMTAANVTDMLSGCNINTVATTTNYDATLVAWETQDLVNSLAFHGGTSKYSDTGQTARAAIVTDDLWTFTDGGHI